jgi:hypothetical protein
MVIPKINDSKYKYLNDDVARFKEDDKYYVLSYGYYLDKECELKYLKKSLPSKILKNYRDICRCKEISQLKDCGIDCKLIENVGDYSRLFKNLNADQISMREHIIGDSERLFYFISGNIFNVVCIKNKHLETDKNRR